MQKKFTIYKKQIDEVVEYLKDQPFNETADGVRHLESVVATANGEEKCQIEGQLVDALVQYLGNKPYRVVEGMVRGLMSLREVADNPASLLQNQE